MRWRFGMADSHEQTLEELGQTLSFELTRKRIRQLEAGELALTGTQAPQGASPSP